MNFKNINSTLKDDDRDDVEFALMIIILSLNAIIITFIFIYILIKKLYQNRNERTQRIISNFEEYYVIGKISDEDESSYL